MTTLPEEQGPAGVADTESPKDDEARWTGAYAFPTWDDLSFEERLDVILSQYTPAEWFNEEALIVCAVLRKEPRKWYALKAQAKERGVDVYGLEKAVDDVVRVVKEAAQAQKITPASAPDGPQPQPALTTLADIQERPVEWLWWPYLAKGTIAMLDGDPGLGKSLLSIQLAASLSRGYPLPDQQGRPTLPTGEPQHVILITSEDSPEHTIKPRLIQAGGDPAYVHILNGWTDPTATDPTEIQAFTLKDVPILEEALRQYPAALVVIDPLQAYLGKVDMHRSNETRPLMARLADLARKHNTVMLCIRHPSKPGQGGGRAIHLGLGSIDFIGIARTGLNVLPHPMDPSKALLAQGKNNLGPLGRTLIFSKAEGLFTWAGVSRLTADVLVSTRYGPEACRLIEACFWLEEQLAGKPPQLAKDLEELMEEEGIKPATLKRAKKLLGIRSLRSGSFSAPIWHWKLPDLTITPPPTPEPLEPLELLEPLEPLGLLRENQILTDILTSEAPQAPVESVEALEVLEDLEGLVVQVVNKTHPLPKTLPLNGHTSAPTCPQCNVELMACVTYRKCPLCGWTDAQTPHESLRPHVADPPTAPREVERTEV